MLTFNARGHEYLFAGTRVISVTQALAPLMDLSRIPPERLEYKRQVGTAMHKAAELDVQGLLDEDSLHPVLAPYFAAWRKFRAECRIENVVAEKPLYSKLYHFAGTPDLVCLVKRVPSIIDLKCSVDIRPVTALQTAGYQILAEDNGQPIKARYAISLREDGRYQMVEYRRRTDRSVFLCQLNVVKWVRSNQ
ncbi:MAG: hypothetical protein KGL39_42970 [Patescibacteria group bacterium]|nr:hypothetical protein [Patescibacteria group bacterium]